MENPSWETEKMDEEEKTKQKKQEQILHTDQQKQKEKLQPTIVRPSVSGWIVLSTPPLSRTQKKQRGERKRERQRQRKHTQDLA